MEHFGYGAKSVSQLNWLSFDDIDNNLHVLNDEQYSSIRALLNEANTFDRDEKGKIIPNPTTYVGNCIMAHLANFEWARQMTWCGTTGNLNYAKSTPCSKWKYCERCADTKRKYYFKKYAHIYSSTPNPCYFVTITPDLDKKVKFVDGNTDLAILHWDKMNMYVDSMYTCGMIKGAVVVEEASFDSYYPHPILNPHIHFVCVANEYGLKSHRFDGMKIDVKLIDNEEHWVKGLNYLHKSIQFFHTYNFEWTPDKAEVISRNFRDMLNNHKHCISNRNQTRAIGILHAKNKQSIVKSTKVMEEEKKARQEAEKKLESINMFEEFNKGAHSRLRRSLEKKATNIIDVGPSPVAARPPDKKKETPFYKNPWVIGGGLLAGAAGVYGAGKLYNSGNNVVNDTFGKGVDDYVVNPIKSLFTPREEPKTLPPTQGINVPTPKMDTLSGTVNKGNPISKEQYAGVIDFIKNKPIEEPKDFYSLAAKFGPKPYEYKGEFPELQGISPLRPELQMKGLADNPTNKSIIDQVNSVLTSQQNIRETLTKARSFLNGDTRTQSLIPEFQGKTPEEVERIANALQDDLTKITNVASSKQGLIGYLQSLGGTAKEEPLLKRTLNAAQLPALGYDLGSLAAPYVASKLPAVSNGAANLLGPAASATLKNLSPVTAGIFSGHAGWRLGGDTADDPTSVSHQALAGLGLSPESMRYAGAVGHGGLAAGMQSLAIPSIRKAVIGALARGAGVGASTLELSPAVAIPAAITTTLAAPIADMATDHYTKKFNAAAVEGQNYTTLFNQLLAAKKQMETNNNALEMKGLLATNNFRNLGSSPEDVQKLIADMGEGPANALLTAKKEGVMGLLSQKINDLLKSKKYIPAPPPQPTFSAADAWQGMGGM